MSTETVDRKRYEKAHHAVTVEVSMNEPALVQAAFDLIRQLAKTHGMSDVGMIYVHLTVEFSGQTELTEVDEMGTRLDNLWLGQVTKHEATPLREVGETPKTTVHYK